MFSFRLSKPHYDSTKDSIYISPPKMDPLAYSVHWRSCREYGGCIRLGMRHISHPKANPHTFFSKASLFPHDSLSSRFSSQPGATMLSDQANNLVLVNAGLFRQCGGQDKP
ncbi:hypothetical protein ABW19_dt0200021 [Dactylella cylindrospora]|nr:hypothetical protein ABW19_dt0200021 [Dactylella cylindrospora]